MGGSLSLAQFKEDESFEIEGDLVWESHTALRPRWIVDGTVVGGLAVADQPAPTEGRQEWRQVVRFSPAKRPQWMRFDLVDARGNTQVIGNPVYFDPAP